MWIETYAELAAQILAAPARLGRCRLVAVDGPSGAGKSRFTDLLATALGEPAANRPGRDVPSTPTTVHTDDLLDGWADQFTFWSRLQLSVLDPLRAGRPGRYRRYDWHAGRFGDEWTVVPPAGVLLLDGVSAARAQLRPELTRSVFVTAPEHLRVARSLARDGVQAQPHLDAWRAAERRHFAADGTEQRVDLVVDGAPTGPHDARLQYVRLR